ncbi:MAG: hypothetical protein ACYDER_14875 [Ktedonobacteraceae bacterium]
MKTLIKGLLLLAAIGGLVIGIMVFSSSSSQPTPVAHALQQGPGIPAIQPVSTNLPSFSSADVQRYFLTHSFPGGRTVSGNRPAILHIKFVTAKQASILLQGELVSQQANQLVCYVELQGPFDLTAMKGPANASRIFQNGYVIFDAHTGNILMWGATGAMHNP